MASGATLVSFEVTDYRPPLTNPARPDVRNGIPVLNFSTALAESAHFSAWLPRHYAGGGITARICWTAKTATSGTCTWSVAFERHDTGTDLDADSFASAVSAAAATAPATSGQPLYTEVALTNGAQLDGLLIGERFRLKITRATGGHTGDAELHGVELRET